MERVKVNHTHNNIYNIVDYEIKEKHIYNQQTSKNLYTYIGYPS